VVGSESGSGETTAFRNAFPEPTDQPLAAGGSARGWSVLVFVLGALASLAWAWSDAERLRDERMADLSGHADSSVAAMQEQLQASETMIRSVQAVFMLLPEVSPQAFDRLYERLQPRTRFPSLQAVTWSPRPQAPAAHLVTTQVVPLAGNERVVGLDLSTQPANLVAVEQSRDQDRVLLSGPFRLRQASSQDARVDGITMRVPVYSAGPLPRTIAARRERFTGSVAVSFRVSGLIDDALQGDARQTLHIRIHDITGVSLEAGPEAGALLFDSHPGRQPDESAVTRRDLHYGGRVWRM